MKQAGLSSGDEVDSYCGKCKLERVHNVVALVDGAVAKVICKTCGSQHRYKPVHPESGAAPAKKKRSRAKTAAASSKTERWEDVLEERKHQESKPYSPKDTFDQGDVIEHNQFGLGVVTQVEGPGKIHVLFEQGPKRLICNRGGN